MHTAARERAYLITAIREKRRPDMRHVRARRTTDADRQYLRPEPHHRATASAWGTDIIRRNLA